MRDFVNTIAKQKEIERNERKALRDKFATKAMQTLLKDIDADRILTEHNNTLLNKIIEASYKVADTMLKIRKQHE